METSEAIKDANLRSGASRSNRFLRRLVWLYGTFAVLVAALLSVAVWPIDIIVHPL